ncbi:lasso peptide biosynthesis protein [Falsiroseomonas tokyonensis]|uniref:Lasso peptide biosynthesis protein n=1 Tax=Falsiroseomonas tokyonensis TaxID=430521 RepID=A0ABV7BUZ7_9PROT|nr:lasso peptide biosynthesis protein [Falsiroseomonas tokyonensis]MBU8539071.1 lasso peptide biosynthesis protein [Falsiroseomonas tokyonensis]
MILAQARRFLETVWPEWHAERGRPLPAIPSTGTCGRSACFLQRVLAEAGQEARIRHGWFLAPGRPPARHAWVESTGLILDLTADQFGAPPLLGCPAPDARYRPGTDTADPSFQAARAVAVAAIWPRWQAATFLQSGGHPPG